MADNTGTADKRETTKASSRKIRPDTHDRFEITAGNNEICGEIWINKDRGVTSADTFTITVN
jgi:hypothetical protein